MNPFPSVPQLGVERSRAGAATRLVASPPQACELRSVLSACFESLLSPPGSGNFDCPALPNPSPNKTMPIVRNMMRMSSQNEAF